MSQLSPLSPETDACPSHYRIPDANCRKCGHPIQPVDLLQSLDGLTFSIAKYAIRAGRKPGESALKDLGKCMDFLKNAIRREENRASVSRESEESSKNSGEGFPCESAP